MNSANQTGSNGGLGMVRIESLLENIVISFCCT